MTRPLMHNLFPRQSLPDQMLDRLLDTEIRVRGAHESHLGNSFNLSLAQSLPVSLQQFLIANFGDPYIGSHYASEVCDMERESVGWLMRLWGCRTLSDYWGSIGASGSESIIWGIHLGREALPDAVLLHSAEAHYCVPKAARLQRMEAIEVASNPVGEIDLTALERTVAGLRRRAVILVLTCGTTMKGAHDDITGAIALLEAAGIGPDRRYVHLDGALNAMVIPFLQDAPDRIRPLFDHGIDSISTSGHKMIGSPMPCGALVVRKGHIDRMARTGDHPRTNDTTLLGTRNGHAVLHVWARLFGHGYGGYAHDALSCSQRAQSLAARLRKTGAEVLCNPHALTVMFEEPDEDIVRDYQLATGKGRARAVVMPNVTDELLDRFAGDFENWRRWRRVFQ